VVALQNLAKIKERKLKVDERKRREFVQWDERYVGQPVD
jgi:hypothetical protein